MIDYLLLYRGLLEYSSFDFSNRIYYRCDIVHNIACNLARSPFRIMSDPIPNLIMCHEGA